MSKQRLKNLFLLCLSSVVVIGGGFVAVMLARGNTFTPDGIQTTGTIRLNVSPISDIRVFLDEQSKSITGNNVVDNILPGEYELRIQRDGYNDWHQKVTVYAGLVTDVTVQLFSGVLPPEQLTKNNVGRAFYSNNRRYVYYSVINTPIGNNIGIWQHTLQQSNIPLIEERPLKITNLVDSIKRDVEKGEFTVIPSNNDNKLLFITKDNYYLIDTGRYNEPSALNQLVLSYPIDAIEWLSDSNHLLIQSGDLLIDYNTDNKSSTIITYQPAKTPVYSLTAGGAVFYWEADVLMRYASGTSSVVPLENLQLPSGVTRIYASRENDKELLLRTSSSLYFLDAGQSSLSDLGNYQVVSMAPSVRSILVRKTSESPIESVEVNVSVVRNAVEIARRATELPDNLSSSDMIWSPNSVYIVFYNSEDPGNLYTADKTGNNLTLVLNNPSLIPGDYGIPSDNSGIIVKLMDGEVPSGGKKNSNLYKLLIR